MQKFVFEQDIKQLEKRKGGYFYFQIGRSIVEQLSKQKATRLICEIEDKVVFPCGLNHLGDGNFFIIVAGKYLKVLEKKLGDVVSFRISEDPNPLGVEIPEILQALLDQDSQINEAYESLTDGKKRSLIYAIKGIKDVDSSVKKILDFLHAEKIRAATKANK